MLMLNAQFPFLSLIIFLPAIAGLVILALPADRRNWIRWTALGTALATLLLAILVYISFDTEIGGYQWVEGPYPWIPGFGALISWASMA